MSVGKAIYAVCTGNSGWTAVGGTRLFPLELPQNPKYPAATYRVISAPRVRASFRDPGLVQARVQIDHLAPTYASARALADATRGVLERYRGASGDVVVQDSFLMNEWDLDDGEERLVRVIQEYEIWYEEEAAGGNGFN